MSNHPATRLRRAAAGLAVVGALALSACSAETPESSDGDALVTIRVATSVSNSFPFIAIQAGERLGTWEEYGIEVEVIEATTPTIGQVMAGGQADIALSGASSAAASIELGLEATIVASNLSYWDQRIIARPDVTSLEQLKGGNFGVSGAGSPGDYSVVKLAESMGWSEDEYTVTSVGNLQALRAALQAGTIDAFAWNSQTAFQLEQSGDAVVIADGADFVGDNVLQSFAVMDSFAEQNPEAVQTFFEAYFAMVEKLIAEPQLFIDVLVEDWDVDPTVAAAVAEESLPKLSTDGVITESELAGIKDAAEFTMGDGTVIDEVKYVYWEDLS